MDKEIIANLKVLSLDMIDNATSGHPGIALSASSIIYTVYANHMHINVKDSKWLGRDRFVMSAGHGSALLYATLYMCGFLNMDDLKAFRKVHSRTPGHPEYNVTPGVDASTGPLGQGLATAVGMAIGAKHMSAFTNKPELTDYYIYVLCSDGDLMEGISYEASSLAGHLNLNNLIILYDSNRISLDGETNYTFTEDILERFDSMGFWTISVNNKVNEINKAIIKAKRAKMPAFIEVKTILGEGSILAGTNKVHGKPLTKEDISQIKTKLGIKDEPFYVNEQAKELFREKVIQRSEKKYNLWQNEYNDYVNTTLDGDALAKFINKKFSFSPESFPLDIPKEEELRVSNHKILNFLSGKTDLIFGGSADLASSTKTYLDGEGDFNVNDYKGKNIWYGVREHAMGAITNGLALTGYLPFASTFLAFADYLKPAIRMSALMDLPVTYIFTHDSISIGADGPTHEPIEQLASLRSIPNFIVYRPADFHELLGAWQTIISLKKPSALIISKEKIITHTETKSDNVLKGAYIALKEKKKIDAIIIATGTELSLALAIAKELASENIDLRVVSMPCRELFLKQDKKYYYEILPVGTKAFVIESGSSFGLREFVSNDKYLITLNTFGLSGKKDDVLRKMNFDKDTIKQKIKDLL